MELFKDFTVLQQIFALCALVGGIGLVLRLILQFVGGVADADADFDAGDVDVDVDVDMDIDADVDADVGDADGTGAATASFHLLSLHGITAFFLMFGLVGLMLSRRAKMGSMLALVGGTAAGFAALYLVAKAFQWMRSLQSSGTINLQNAVGEVGTVYLRIPAEGTGKIQVAVQGRLRTLNAVAEDKQELSTGRKVQVVNVVGGNTMVVKKA
jgi:membrane protein implicated in regulation of membrane protease activity